MTSTLLNISGKIDPQTVALFEMVGRATIDLDMPYVVVGATARDIAYLLQSYEKIPEVIAAVHDESNAKTLEAYDWDRTQSAACLLGRRASSIAKENTRERIKAFTNEELGNLNLDLLVVEMCTHIENEFDRKLQLLSAFMDGFNE